MSARALAVLVAVGCIWGASYLFIRVAVDEVEPVPMLAFRTVFGAVTLLAIASHQKRHLELSPRLLAGGLVLALVGAIVPFLLIAWAEKHIESGPASVLNATTPLFTVLFAASAFDDERVTPRALLGVGLGLAGVAILTGEDLRRLSGTDGLAQIAVVAAAAAYGAGNVCARVLLLRQIDPIALSALQFSLAALAAVGLSLGFDQPSFDLSFEVWLSLLALGVLSSGLAYVGYYWLIEQVGSFRSSLVSYVIPVAGVALGAIVLGETLRWSTFAGGLVIALGVAVGTGRGRAGGATGAERP